MVSHADLILYLVAIKSFYRQIGHGQIVIVDDGSLTDSDRSLFAEHLNSPQFFEISQVQTGSCPRGGCWERLLTVLDVSNEYYVIQLDADTLTRANISEVLRCIEQNQSFTLGTDSGTEFVTAAESARHALSIERAAHVQVEAEKNLARIPDSARRQYVRGSAGFTGFGRRAVSRSDVEQFSNQMREYLGQRWAEWGTEQVTSNYLIANAPNSIVLPFPKYRCYRSGVDPHQSAFLHFVGINRYDQGIYRRESQLAIREGARTEN
jgi:hypothetical protein